VFFDGLMFVMIGAGLLITVAYLKAEFSQWRREIEAENRRLNGQYLSHKRQPAAELPFTPVKPRGTRPATEVVSRIIEKSRAGLSDA